MQSKVSHWHEDEYTKECCVVFLPLRLANFSVDQWKNNKMWPDIGKPTLLAQNNFHDKAVKVFRYFSTPIVIALIKQLISFLAVKFEPCNSFLLGDTVVFIPPGGCAQKVGFPRSGHKWRIWLNLKNIKTYLYLFLFTSNLIVHLFFNCIYF